MSIVDGASLPSNLVKSAVIIAGGAFEGYFMAMAGLFHPAAFRAQMRFDSFIIMKMFVSALATSMIVQALVFDKMMPELWAVSRTYRRVSIGYFRVVGGCFVLGVGMAVAGSGPTMIGVQLGTRVVPAFVIFIGALTGAAVFHILEPYLGLDAEPWRVECDKNVAEDYFNGFPTVDCHGKATAACVAAKGKRPCGRPLVKYHDIALPAGVTLLAAAAAMEYFLPHAADFARIPQGIDKNDAKNSSGGGNMTVMGAIANASIMPIFAGIAIGLNQIPIRYISADGQGGSRSLSNFVSTLTFGAIGGRSRAINCFAKSWQLQFVYIGTVVGAIIASSTLNEASAAAGLSSFFVDVTRTAGYSVSASFIGGALFAFGARFASGCTCGHGISGTSELSLQSAAGAAAIFAGGIATTAILGL